MTKSDELDQLKCELTANKGLPLREGATNLVFGEGDINAKVVLIGEAPGFHEDRLARPFVGNAGSLLNKLLLKSGLSREEVYITNIVKYRPPDNRDPLPLEIQAFAPYLVRQVEIINPSFIVTLGRFSMNYFLPQAKISEVHGRPLVLGGRIIIPMFHPAAALRRSEILDLIESDFEKLPQIILSPEDFMVKGDDENKDQMTLFN